MGFILEILSFLFQGGLLGRGEEEKELREKIKTLEARPQHLPEDILLLERDRFARKLYWIYLVVGISAFWIILLSVQIVFSEMVAPTHKWIMHIGKDLKDFIYILPGIAVETFVAGIAAVAPPPIRLQATLANRAGANIDFTQASPRCTRGTEAGADGAGASARLP